MGEGWGEGHHAPRNPHRRDPGALYAPRLSSAKVVKGAPYSAEVVTETRQSLADGNVISHKKTGLIHRDGEGRTRQETSTEGRYRSIYINDPVENKHYILNPDARRAVVVPRVLHGREDGHTPHRGIVVKRIDAPDGSHREEVRVHVVRSGDEQLTPLPPMPPMPPGAMSVPMPPMPPLPGVHTMRFESMAKLGKGITTDLGMKEFDGVKAEGKSTVWTIPAGEIGNRNPINITSETRYAPELQVTVHSRYDDPRTGETVYRLANIRRGEPSGDLFKVPEEYKVKSRGRS